MARKPRVWWPGAGYHIMCRGNRRSEIFRDDEDRRLFLYMLAQVKEKHPFKLHAYCLMSNHVHFHMETIDTDPGKIMKLLNMKYTLFFNKKYGFVGHLMQGRFQAEVVQGDRYFLALNRYIHLNPVEAGLVIHPKDYRWSSYNAYVEKHFSFLVDTKKTLSYFSDPKIRNFERFTLAEKNDPSNDPLLPLRLQLDDYSEEER